MSWLSGEGGVRQRAGLARADWRYYTKHRRWRALVRALFNTIVLGHYTELCQQCASRYNAFLWWSPQPLWDELMGSPGGLLCPRCFTRKAKAAGIRLSWTPMVVERDGVATTNWWLDQTRDALMMGEPDPGFHPGGLARVPQPTWARVAVAYPVDRPHPYPPENCVSR